jgi:hypothetical protein
MPQRKVFINKSGCYNEHGGIQFIMENSIIVFTRESLFNLFKFTFKGHKTVNPELPHVSG